MIKKIQIPRNEYPRPQMVRDKWMNLNGKWDFEIDHGNSGEDKNFIVKKFSKKIIVPFCPESSLSGINEKDFMNCVWYKKQFSLPSNWKDSRIILHFGAVDYETTVWINGIKVGKHIGGYSSFSFEITKYIKPSNNTIVVRAFDDLRTGLQPSGKQSPKYHSFACFYTRTTGIWQTVWLEAVPENFIKSFKFYPNINSKKLTIQFSLEGDVSNLTLKTILKHNSKPIATDISIASNNMFVSIDIKDEDFELWELDNPFLYDLEFELFNKSKIIDKVKSYVGLREIRIKDKAVLLNNKSVFQRLVLDQGYYPDGIYTAPTEEALKKDIELSMEMGFNGARLHQKVFEPRFLYWADRLGYLVWGEYPNWGLDHANPKVVERVLQEWNEVIERDFNHPSIIGWCPFNETTTNQNPELLRGIYKTTKILDPTRPVIDTSGYVHVETDIYDCHNYEQDPEKFKMLFKDFEKNENAWRNFTEHDAPYLGQPYFVSEYGGIWWNPGQKDEKSWGYGNRPKSEKEFIDRYKKLTEYLLSHPKMFGFCYTQLYDVEQEVNGLYTYYRIPKFSPKIFYKINTKKAEIEKD